MAYAIAPVAIRAVSQLQRMRSPKSTGLGQRCDDIPLSTRLNLSVFTSSRLSHRVCRRFSIFMYPYHLTYFDYYTTNLGLHSWNPRNSGNERKSLSTLVPN